MIRQKFANALLYAAIFLLPWQTRWIYAQLTVGGTPWEYGTLSLYLVEILFVLVAVLRGRPHLPTALVSLPKFLFFFLGTLAISTSFSVRLPLALGAGLHVVAALVFLLVLVDERTQMRRVAWAFCAGLIGPSVLGWMQVMSGASPASSVLGLAEKNAAVAGVSVIETHAGRLLRAYGTFPHPNVFGGYLAVSLVVLGWLGWTGSRMQRLVAVILATVFSTTLVVTFSRSAWLGVMAAMIGLFVWMFQHHVRATKQLFVLALIPVFGTLATCVFFSDALFVRFDTSARLETRSIVEREESLFTFPSVLRANPFTGVGPGNYTELLTHLDPGEPGWMYQPVHNVFLLFIAELGILGIVGFVRLSKNLFPTIQATAKKNPLPFALAAVLIPPVFFDHYLWSLWAGLVLGMLCLTLVLKGETTPK